MIQESKASGSKRGSVLQLFMTSAHLHRSFPAGVLTGGPGHHETLSWAPSLSLQLRILLNASHKHLPSQAKIAMDE